MTFRIRIYSLFEEVVLHVQGGRYHFRKEISSTKDIGHNRHNALFAAIYFLWIEQTRLSQEQEASGIQRLRYQQFARFRETLQSKIE